MTRVLSVIDSLAPGGAERSLVELAPHLGTAGIDLELALLFDRPGFGDELASAGIGVTVLEPAGRPGRARQVARLARARQVDLVHTTLFESDVAGRLAGALARVPVVTTLANVRYGPDQFAEPGLSPRRLRAARAVDVATARLVRRFHAVSHPVAEAMAARLRVPRARIEVIPRGRDRAVLGERSDDRRAAARAGLGVPPGDPLVLAVARHEHQKGLDVLVRAAERLARDRPGLVVAVAGAEGRQTDELRRMIGAAGLDRTVRLLGARRDVADLLCAADAFVLPSRREGFPGAVVEAMAMGTPIVASDIPMVREAVPGERYAAFVPVDDAAALSTAVVGVLDDPATAGRRAAAALERFEDELTIQAVAARMADLFARTAASPGRRAPR